MNADFDEQQDELLALQSIFDSEEFRRDESKCAGDIRVSVELPSDFSVVLKDGETLIRYEISFLPPLLLTFDLPEDYPSSSPPTFTLTCGWLTHTQLSALGAQLIELYQATGGAVVLFSWVQFLREDALKFLGVHSQLELPCDGHSILNSERTGPPHKPDTSAPSPEAKQHLSAPDEGGADSQEALGAASLPPSASSDSLNLSEQGAASLPDVPQREDLSDFSLTPSQTLLSQILTYDASQRERVFAATVFDCGVCFTSWLGSDCVLLDECGHIFCRTCLGEFCKLQITEGTVRSVTCPRSDCAATPTPAQVKSLVGEELFSRYDRLLLQSTLDGMPDVTYCPRRSCGSAVIRDESGNAAMCPVCSFAFCVACGKNYHGAGSCPREKRTGTKKDAEDDGKYVLADLPQTTEGIRALWDDYASGSKERRQLLERRYGTHILQGPVEEGLSDSWISVNSKLCPHCFSKIEKIEGCNVMTCSRCRKMFCWICLAKLSNSNAYEHFRETPCVSYR
ncbi:E3 ubiquitin-protein ligase RNF14-like [Mugil cephalus]|uniref:E3 ubiquitin-protein ligase RNF14-like n=1 Tax=Mugil cephalus TaxID=48193 RepID=UPI001FB5F402|nr:E3 ubiquitin-protein ligase RNF14-like [Mugil cephalus]